MQIVRLCGQEARAALAQSVMVNSSFPQSLSCAKFPVLHNSRIIHYPMRFLVSFQSILKCAVLLLPPLVNLNKIAHFDLAANVGGANLVRLGAWRNPFDPL